MDEYALSLLELGSELAFTMRVQTWPLVWAQEFLEYWFHLRFVKYVLNLPGILMSLHEHDFIVLFPICCSTPADVLLFEEEEECLVWVMGLNVLWMWPWLP